MCLTKQLKKGVVLILGGDVVKSTNLRHWELGVWGGVYVVVVGGGDDGHGVCATHIRGSP